MAPWAPEMADSPFKASDRSPKARAWRLDAILEEIEVRMYAGCFDYRTAQEMAEARAILDPYRPDPADILL